jgi:hypothetical protein
VSFSKCFRMLRQSIAQGILRLVQMGAIVCNSRAVVADLQNDWRKPTAPG